MRPSSAASVDKLCIQHFFVISVDSTGRSLHKAPSEDSWGEMVGGDTPAKNIAVEESSHEKGVLPRNASIDFWEDILDKSDIEQRRAEAHENKTSGTSSEAGASTAEMGKTSQKLSKQESGESVDFWNSILEESDNAPKNSPLSLENQKDTHLVSNTSELQSEDHDTSRKMTKQDSGESVDFWSSILTREDDKSHDTSSAANLHPVESGPDFWALIGAETDNNGHGSEVVDHNSGNVRQSNEPVVQSQTPKRQESGESVDFWADFEQEDVPPRTKRKESNAFVDFWAEIGSAAPKSSDLKLATKPDKAQESEDVDTHRAEDGSREVSPYTKLKKVTRPITLPLGDSKPGNTDASQEKDSPNFSPSVASPETESLSTYTIPTPKRRLSLLRQRSVHSDSEDQPNDSVSNARPSPFSLLRRSSSADAALDDFLAANEPPSTPKSPSVNMASLPPIIRRSPSPSPSGKRTRGSIDSGSATPEPSRSPMGRGPKFFSADTAFPKDVPSGQTSPVRSPSAEKQLATELAKIDKSTACILPQNEAISSKVTPISFLTNNEVASAGIFLNNPKMENGKTQAPYVAPISFTPPVEEPAVSNNVLTNTISHPPADLGTGLQSTESRSSVKTSKMSAPLELSKTDPRLTGDSGLAAPMDTHFSCPNKVELNDSKSTPKLSPLIIKPPDTSDKTTNGTGILTPRSPYARSPTPQSVTFITTSEAERTDLKGASFSPVAFLSQGPEKPSPKVSPINFLSNIATASGTSEAVTPMSFLTKKEEPPTAVSPKVAPISYLSKSTHQSPEATVQIVPRSPVIKTVPDGTQETSAFSFPTQDYTSQNKSGLKTKVETLAPMATVEIKPRSPVTPVTPPSFHPPTYQPEHRIRSPSVETTERSQSTVPGEKRQQTTLRQRSQSNSREEGAESPDSALRRRQRPATKFAEQGSTTQPKPPLSAKDRLLNKMQAAAAPSPVSEPFGARKSSIIPPVNSVRKLSAEILPIGSRKTSVIDVNQPEKVLTEQEQRLKASQEAAKIRNGEREKKEQEQLTAKKKAEEERLRRVEEERKQREKEEQLRREQAIKRRAEEQERKQKEEEDRAEKERIRVLEEKVLKHTLRTK